MKRKLQIEQEYRNRFIPAEGGMQQIQQKPEPSDCPQASVDAPSLVNPPQQQHQQDEAKTATHIKSEEAMDTEMQVQDNGGDSGGFSTNTMSDSEIASLRKQLLRKPSSALERKKNEKQRKARQMRRLRKWLTPKNAIVALHELQGPGMTEFVINTNGHLTKAEIVINNVKYEATGSSKNQAKAKACEKALRDLAIAQMARVKLQQEAKAAKTMAPVPPPAPSMSDTGPDPDESMHGSEVDEDGESDDLPMEHLAAFALHKLFSEWESEGFEVPQIKPLKVKTAVPSVEASTVGVPSMPKVTKTIADLPPDAATRHPTALFAYMRPQVAYKDLGSNDDPLNREFSAAINVDGMQFLGQGRSKKLARKAAAIDACKTLFNVTFDSSVL
uniref:DRBM domain-containing protein n=2 Tax=Anopheles atroparvus TaxID=41427 RepID=A0A182JN54_ANOAO